jgi:hypothetical protein
MFSLMASSIPHRPSARRRHRWIAKFTEMNLDTVNFMNFARYAVRICARMRHALFAVGGVQAPHI